MPYQNNRQLLHRKEFQMMSPSIATNAAGMFFAQNPTGLEGEALYVISVGQPVIYNTNQDGFQLLPSFSLAGTFGAGTCGAWGRWSNNLTATGGSTTTITLTTNIIGDIVGKTVWFQTGTGVINLRRTITRVDIVPGGTNVITLDTALPVATPASSTFKIDSGVYYVLNAYASLVAGVFRSYDVATGVLTSLTTTNLPAAWGTDGIIVSTPSNTRVFASGTATAGGATTLTNSAKTWTTNQWSNYQVRITAGTGIGQVRSIASNTGTILTVSAAWTTNPDATSQYAIEGNDDFLYILGNAAVAMYRYSISANTITLLAPTAARATAPGAGMSSNWVWNTGDTFWQNESSIQDGRYIYSFRGIATTELHRYDVALNTWATITYVRAGETFTTGSSWALYGRYIYGMKENGGRFFRYDVTDNNIQPVTTDFYPQSTAVVGAKMFIAVYSDGTGEDVLWIYYMGNTTTALRRIMIY